MLQSSSTEMKVATTSLREEHSSYSSRREAPPFFSLSISSRLLSRTL